MSASNPPGRYPALLHRVLSSLRLKPFDQSSESGRAQERHRRIALTALASAAARGIGVVTALVTVPLTVHYLGDERYGLWMAASSVIAVLGFADLGMGNGLLSVIADAHGRDDRQSAQEYVSSGFALLSGIGLAIMIAFLTAYSWVDWAELFNVKDPTARAEAGPCVIAFIGCFALSLPSSVVNRVQLGYQEGFIANLWTGVANIASLGAVLAAVHVHASLPTLVLALVGTPAVVLVVNGVFLLRKRPWLTPSLGRTSRRAMSQLLRTGILFFLLQVAMALSFASDNLVIARVLGASAVTDYAIPSRLFGTIGTILPIVLAPLWPAYGESIARGDLIWIRRTLVRSVVLSAVSSGLGSLVLVSFGATIIRLWVGDAVPPPSFQLLLPLGIWSVLNAMGSAAAMLLNGLGALRFQATLAICMGVTGLALKFALARAIGTEGVIWATVIAYVVWIAIPFAVWVPRLLRQMDGRQGAES